MCYKLGGRTCTQAKHTKLKMKTLTSETMTIGAWGLHLSSFVMASIPYLQVISLLLAIGVSILTLRKLIKDSKAKRKRSSDEKIF